MDDTAVIDSFRKKVCADIEVEKSGLDRYIVYTPFMFDDGDHFVVILRKEGERWYLADEGHTFMHLSYDGVDLARGTRGRIVEESLAAHGVDDRNGELILGVPGEEFGDALFSYLQALAKTATVAKFTVERIASAFFEDFKELMSEIIPQGRYEFAWHDQTLDPDGNYVVDCRINNMNRPCYVFAINNNDKCTAATIACMKYERDNLDFSRIALFEDQSTIGRRQLAQLSDVVDKQFSSLGDRRRISDYFHKQILDASRR